MVPPTPPLAPGFRTEPLWHVGVELPDEVHERRPLPAEADVAIVGAGYCGVMAGARLAERGRAAVVLEADPIGVGASTRNGGMVIPELKHGPELADGQVRVAGRGAGRLRVRRLRSRRATRRRVVDRLRLLAHRRPAARAPRTARSRSRGRGSRVARRARRGSAVPHAWRAARGDRDERVPRRPARRADGWAPAGEVPRGARAPGARRGRAAARLDARDGGRGRAAVVVTASRRTAARSRHATCSSRRTRTPTG